MQASQLAATATERAISQPFKLLLIVLVDGWTRLIHGLVLTCGASGAAP